jgi:hypothetical protein
MSKIFSSKKKEVSKTEIDPQIYNRVLGNLAFAEQVAAIPYEPYRGMMVAPFTRDYMAGEAMTRRIAQEGGFVPELEAAARQSFADLGYQAAPITTRGIDTRVTPERVAAERIGASLAGGPRFVGAGRVGTTFAARDIAAPGTAPTVQGAGFLERDIGQYMNPYQQQVIEAGLEDIGRAEERARMARSQRATAARAFGGSRAAIEEGIAAGEAARERNRLVAEQRAQGFREAAALREADVGREQQARLANQEAIQRVMDLAQRGQISNQQRDIELSRLGFSAEQANVEAAMRSDLANQQATQEYMRAGLSAEEANQRAMADAAARNQEAALRARQMTMGAEEQQAQRELEAARASEAARLEAGRFRGATASNLAGFGATALQNRYGAGAAMMGLGQAQQNLYQQFLNAQREEDFRRQQFPLQQLAIRQGAVQASPMNQTTTGTVTSRPSYWEMAGRVAAAFGSDENMKTNIKGIKNPLDKVNRLKGIEFEWEDGYSENEGEDKGGEEDMGMSAQSIEKVMPEAVSRRESDGMRQYNLPQLVGLLTEAVKELDQKVEGGKRRGKA